MSFFVEPIIGAIVGKIWDERVAIARFAKDFYDLVTKGRHRIFVFGCAGTGKSTFGRILDGQEDLARISGRYLLSEITEHFGCVTNVLYIYLFLRDSRFIMKNIGQLFTMNFANPNDR